VVHVASRLVDGRVSGQLLDCGDRDVPLRQTGAEGMSASLCLGFCNSGDVNLNSECRPIIDGGLCKYLDDGGVDLPGCITSWG
jgi:hypothetical protein